MSLEQIGQKLKAAREGQGFSYAQIHERTKIPVNHLQSIDTGMTEDLPEPVYVAGFIKRYAEVVGLNGQTLSEEYRKESGETRSGNGHGPWNGKGSATPQMVVPAPYVHRTRVEQGSPNLISTLVWPAIWGIVAIALIAWLEWHTYNDAAKQDPSVMALQEAARKFNSVQATTPAIPPPSANPTQAGAQPAAEQAPPPPSDEQLTLVASKHVWVDVKAVSSGETLFGGFLEAGDRRDFKDAQGIRVHAGNGGSLNIEIQGKTQVLGAPGKIAEKVFMAANPQPAGATGTTPGADGKSGSILGTPGTTPPKPKKPVVKKPTSGDAAGHKRYRSIDEGGSHSASESGRSVDVPYRYTEGRLDNE